MFDLESFDAVWARAADRTTHPYDSIEAWTSEPTQLGGWDVIDPALLGAVPTIEMVEGQGAP